MGTLQSYEHPRAGHVKVVGPAVRFSETPAKIERPAPLIGEHSIEILENAGFGPDEIRRLLASKAIAQNEEPRTAN